ncbi:exo-alpha-sialidase [Brachyspira aalborgi]|uniref:sialidase family protein n=1 Tax=Brachyspira aalborgi TaxID=29522 RepID=UPI0011CB60AD|nr:sialidase family protein [Brachyspira aalborgi]TXJ15864.1 exo-alpha-sialidase [Brachyspira aalborgi]TXJ19364.1 exo-alpha-sialidase [Brachyspira aalborgi]
MKKAKNLLLISVGVIILGMSILYSCKNYTGPSNGQGLFADKEKANNVDSGEDSAGTQMLTPDSQRVVVWADSGIIPALTVTKDNTLIAAVGDKNNKGKILIKTSKDLGKTWTSYNGEIKSDKINNGIAHPFFINCHNGDILLGIATTNTGEDTVSFYRGSANATVWSKESSTIEKSTGPKNQANTSLKPGNAFATYGNGIALKHGTNTSKNTLLFPYYYKDTTKNSGVISTMISTNDGKHWEPYGNDEGPYASYGAKFIELNDGNVLYFMSDNFKKVGWFESKDCGKTSKCITLFSVGAHNEDRIEYADFTRYEFDGRDIKGAEYALMVFSTDKKSYSVKMTTDDFNKGKDNKSGAYLGGGSKVIAANLTKPSAIYPTITVLKDGTIATLAAEDDGMVFRRFELNWFLEDELWMEQ